MSKNENVTAKLKRSDIISLFFIVRAILAAPSFTYAVMMRFISLGEALNAEVKRMQAAMDARGTLKDYLAECRKLKTKYAKRAAKGNALRDRAGEPILDPAKQAEYDKASAELVAAYAVQGHDIPAMLDTQEQALEDFRAEIVEYAMPGIDAEMQTALQKLQDGGPVKLKGTEYELLKALYVVPEAPEAAQAETAA